MEMQLKEFINSFLEFEEKYNTVASLMWKSMPVAEAMAGHSIHRPVSIMAQMHRRRELSCMI